jgi:hypothetical protein
MSVPGHLLNAAFGELLPVALNAVGLLSIVPTDNIGGIEIQATLEEMYSDTLQVTEHPVQAGALISDHAFKRPKEVMLRCGWSNSSAQAAVGAISGILTGGGPSVADYVGGVYSQLVALQESLTPFNVTTTLRTYTNMMFVSLSVLRDASTSQALMVTATLREVIITDTQSSVLPPQANQASPQNTAATQNMGPVLPLPATPAPGGSLQSFNWLPTVPTS